MLCSVSVRRRAHAKWTAVGPILMILPMKPRRGATASRERHAYRLHAAADQAGRAHVEFIKFHHENASKTFRFSAQRWLH